MPDVDAVLEAPARRFYDSIARPADKHDLDAVIRSICEDPSTNGGLKFAIPSSDKVTTVFADGKFVVLFEHLNNWTISIVNIAYDKDVIAWDNID